jgi:hypothetical protein
MFTIQTDVCCLVSDVVSTVIVDGGKRCLREGRPNMHLLLAKTFSRDGGDGPEVQAKFSYTLVLVDQAQWAHRPPRMA